jgi:hypothetical protein
VPPTVGADRRDRLRGAVMASAGAVLLLLG